MDSPPPAVVHVDLDGAVDIHAAHGWPYAHTDDPLFVSGLRALLTLLDELRIRATLFVVARALDDPLRRALIEDAVRRGHRIGSHTLTHRWLPALPLDEQRREIAGSREALTRALGVPIDGFRAPGFGTDPGIRALVAEAGYRFDSSMFARRPGPIGPVVLPGGLVELPLPRPRPLPLPFHPSYSLVIGNWYFRAGLAAYRRSGAPMVLLFHLTDLADALSADYLMNWKARVFTLSYLPSEVKRRRCMAMLTAAARNYQWATDEDLILHAQNRADGTFRRRLPGE